MPPKWDLEKHGFDQLTELNAMERQQDTNLWASSAIFLAASGVLLIATATAASKANLVGVLAAFGLGILGLIVTYAWSITADRAHTYEDQWLKRAEALELELGVPPRFAVWGRRPSGPSARSANRALRLAVGGTWLVVIVTSIAWLIHPF